MLSIGICHFILFRSALQFQFSIGLPGFQEKLSRAVMEGTLFRMSVSPEMSEMFTNRAIYFTLVIRFIRSVT